MQDNVISLPWLFQADPNNTGSIGALDAASFLKKSSLSDTTLSQVSPELNRSIL